MAQPVFLKNFTLDGFNIGELFVVANVTIPFLSVERSYYTVGNTDGENLRSTRLNATDITIDGFLIKDFSGMSISETKDNLVAQVMSRQTQQLVFDALPDRYFNVVFDGTQEYDASDDNMTALTLTFKCPEGVAHSITPDVFRNVASTNANWLVDSEFQTKTFWNEDTYVPDFKRSNAAVLGLDYSEYTIDELENASTDLVADNVFYEDESMAVGDMWSFSADYAILKKSDLDLSNDGTLEVVIDELDKVNGKVLGSTTYPMEYGSVDTGGQVMTAYAFDSTGKDRFSFEDNTMPNMYPINTSEAPIPLNYQSSVVTTTLNQNVPEWGASNAVRSVITGGTSTIKGRVATGLLTVGGVTYTTSIYAKNNGTTPVVINSNFAGSITLQPMESRRVSFTSSRPIGASDASIQWIIQVADVSQSVDVTLWRAKTSANTELDVWTEANQGATDNTTPKYVGFSTTDNDSPNNKVLNGAFNSSIGYWTRGGIDVPTFNGEYGEIVKSAGTSRAYIADNRAEYELNGSVSQGSPVTGSVDVFLVDGITGNMNSTELMVYFTYADNTTQSLLAKVDQTKVGQWQTLTVSGVVANKPIARTQILFYMDTTLSGRIRLKNFMLTETDAYVPFAPHVTERGALYTWYAYGTSFNPETATFQRKGLRYRVVEAESKVLRLSINMYGNAHVLINRPNLEKEATATYRYIVSNKQWLQAIPMHNYGTWKSYPRFEINNMNENGLIGIINENGDVLQFGNEENVDDTEPISDQYGLRQSYASTARPSGYTVNSGHVSNYPYTGNDPEKPNIYGGTWDFKGTEIVQPSFPSTAPTGAWIGPSLTSNIAAPTSGLRTGAFRMVERLNFGTNGEKRGRLEFVILTDTNDILMGLTVRDSNASTNEVILEYWYGNRLLKSIKTDVKKYKNTFFRITMTRDSTGKKFSWNFENIQDGGKGKPFKVITKNPFNYSATVANKASVVKNSRWSLRWQDGKGQREVIDKTTYTMKSKEILNIRNGATTNSKSNGLLPKNKTFSTTNMKTGQQIVKNNQWYYVTKDTKNGIPATGWVTGHYLTQTKKVVTKKKVIFDATTKMNITDSVFLWVGSGKPKNAKNPFKAGDVVFIDTYDKTIFVNGVEREDLGTIGNMWEGFAFEPGEHYLRFVNSKWGVNTMEVSIINERTYL